MTSGRPISAMPSDLWSATVPPRSACWTCSAFWTNPATRKCRRRTWTTSPWSRSQQVAALFRRSSVMSSWPWRMEEDGGIGIRSPRGSGTWSGRGCDPRLCRSSRPWRLVRALWWPDWKRRPKRRTTPPCVCKKWLELDWHFVFDPPNDKDLDLPLEWREQPLWFFESLFFLLVVSDNNLRGKLEHEAKWTSRSSATIGTGMWALEARISETGTHIADATTSVWVQRLEKKGGREWMRALEGRGIKETGDATD